MTRKEISEAYKAFLKQYKDKYRKYQVDIIKEDFWYYLGETEAPDIIMQIYSELGIVGDKGDFYDLHIKKILENFNIGCHITDVASGFFPSFANKLAQEQLKINKGTITLYEPLLVVDKPKFPNMTLKKECFTLNTDITSTDLVTSIFPCEITLPIIEQACRNQKDFYIAMCGCSHLKMGFHIVPPLVFQDHVMLETQKLLKEYDNGELVVDYLGDEYEFNFPILYNRKNK